MIQQLTLLEISLDDFEEWLTSASWNMHQDSEPSAIRLVGKIELLISEMDASNLSEAAIVKGLSALGGIFEMGNTPNVRIVATSSSARFIPFMYQAELSEGADKQPGLVFSYTPLLPA